MLDRTKMLIKATSQGCFRVIGNDCVIVSRTKGDLLQLWDIKMKRKRSRLGSFVILLRSTAFKNEKTLYKR